MRLTHIGVMVGSVLTGAVLLAGCTDSAANGSTSVTPARPTGANPSSSLAGSVSPSAPTSPTAGDIDASGTADPPAADASASSRAASGPGLCTPTVTRADVDVVSGGSEHHGYAVHVFNASSSPCVTTGYPGVALLGSNGQTVANATRTPRGYLGGLGGGSSAARIVLQPGQQATSLLETSSVDSTGATCTTADRFLFTLPDNTDPITLQQSQIPVCQAEVHPLVAGASGSQDG